jgi:hypothetical protein
MSFTKKDLRDYNYFMKQRRRYCNLFHTLNQIRKTKELGIINFYHKRPDSYVNKLAYLAGLVDGEGYLKYEKNGTMRLIIGMCDKKTIYWIKKNFGGNVTFQKTAKGKDFYVWRINQGKEQLYLFLLLIPFLVNKRKIIVNGLKLLIKKFNKLQHCLYPYGILRKRGQ